jgi:hypothetical protein
VTALALVAACGQSPGDKPVEAGDQAPTTNDPTTTSAPADPVYPLTGLPLDDPTFALHPAVVVKIDNSPDSRPQTGLNEADIVYELLVEGITRYALVFHSQMLDSVGPVRSARSSDIELLANLGAPLLAWSGGNPGVTNEVRAAVEGGFLVDAGHDVFPAEYRRDGSRSAPHNLYVNIGALLEGRPPSAPPSLFRYRAPLEAPAGGLPDAGGYVVDFGGGVRAEYVWDAERGGWDRFQTDGGSRATVDHNGVQVAPQNVVIMFVPYGQSPSDARSPMALTTGEGDAVVLTAGKAVQGRWKRPNGLFGWELVDAFGQPITLSPGRTWVALPEVGSASHALDPAAAAALLAERA